MTAHHQSVVLGPESEGHFAPGSRSYSIRIISWRRTFRCWKFHVFLEFWTTFLGANIYSWTQQNGKECLIDLVKLYCGLLIREVLRAHTCARVVKEESPSTTVVMAWVIGERPPKREKMQRYQLQPPLLTWRS